MQDILEKIEKINWQDIALNMHEKGYALVPDFLPPSQCAALIDQYDQEEAYRKTVTMERHRFGLGQYKYYTYPLPPLIQNLRQSLYAKLAPMANAWVKCLNIDKYFPKYFEDFQAECHTHHQDKPTPLILKYTKGGFNTLHQDLYGEVYFPLQAAFFLNEPEKDYTGGEFILTEQVPRAQSKAIVLKPGKGSMLIFTTNFRPVKSARGYTRATMKHGVSEVHGGKRHIMGVIFHDAVN